MYELLPIIPPRKTSTFDPHLDGTSNATTYSYDDFGRTIAVTDPLTNTIHTAYDLHNRVIRESGATYPVEYAYDLYGQRTALRTWRDETGTPDTTTWDFDPATGLLLQKLYADNQGPSYTYTPDGQLAARTWARGITATYTYTPSGQLVSTTYSDDTPSITYTYDHWEQPQTVTDATGTTTFAYTPQGILQSEAITGLYTKTLTHHTDTFGRDIGYTINTNRQTTNTYDPATGRLATMTTESGTFTWAYLPNSRSLKATLTYPDATVSRFDYESDRNLTASITLTHVDSLLSQYTYRYTPLAQRTESTFSVPAFSLADTIHYRENTRGEITAAHSQIDQSYSYDFEFDHAGNRIRASENGAETPYAVNALNQYTQIDGFTPAFDAAGNQTRIKTVTGVWAVEYDADNRPVRWVQGNTSIIMDYDYLGRRIRYRSLKEGVAQSDKRFVYNGNVCVEQLNALSSNSVESAFIWDPTEPSATRPLAFIRPGETTLFYAHDANKNVSELFNASLSGIVSTHYAYAPFGELVQKAGTDVPNPFRFSSEFYDEELGLVYFNYRHYDPRSGRWLSRDPLGEDIAENLYWMNRNDTINAWDELGFNSFTPSTKEQCEEQLKKWNNNSGYLGKIKARIKEEGCLPPEISCEQCPCNNDDDNYVAYESIGKKDVYEKRKIEHKNHNGSISWTEEQSVKIGVVEFSKITMCHNNLRNLSSDYIEALAHEYTHSLQRCTKNNYQEESCEKSICHEIEAYYIVNCKTARDRKGCTKLRYKASSKATCGFDLYMRYAERDENGKRKKDKDGKQKLDVEEMNEKMDAMFEELFDSCSEANGLHKW